MQNVIDELEKASNETRIVLDLLDYALEDISNSKEYVVSRLGRMTSVLHTLWQKINEIDTMQQRLITELLTEKKRPSRAATLARGRSK